MDWLIPADRGVTLMCSCGGVRRCSRRSETSGAWDRFRQTSLPGYRPRLSCGRVVAVVSPWCTVSSCTTWSSWPSPVYWCWPPPRPLPRHTPGAGELAALRAARPPISWGTVSRPPDRPGPAPLPPLPVSPHHRRSRPRPRLWPTLTGVRPARRGGERGAGGGGPGVAASGGPLRGPDSCILAR